MPHFKKSFCIKMHDLAHFKGKKRVFQMTHIMPCFDHSAAQKSEGLLLGLPIFSVVEKASSQLQKRGLLRRVRAWKAETNGKTSARARPHSAHGHVYSAFSCVSIGL